MQDVELFWKWKITFEYNLYTSLLTLSHLQQHRVYLKYNNIYYLIHLYQKGCFHHSGCEQTNNVSCFTWNQTYICAFIMKGQCEMQEIRGKRKRETGMTCSTSPIQTQSTDCGEAYVAELDRSYWFWYWIQSQLTLGKVRVHLWHVVSVQRDATSHFRNPNMQTPCCCCEASAGANPPRRPLSRWISTKCVFLLSELNGRSSSWAVLTFSTNYFCNSTSL